MYTISMIDFSQKDTSIIQQFKTIYDSFIEQIENNNKDVSTAYILALNCFFTEFQNITNEQYKKESLDIIIDSEQKIADKNNYTRILRFIAHDLCCE